MSVTKCESERNYSAEYVMAFIIAIATGDVILPFYYNRTFPEKFLSIVNFMIILRLFHQIHNKYSALHYSIPGKSIYYQNTHDVTDRELSQHNDPGFKKHYTKIPKELIRRIVKEGWSIIEMCAGNGEVNDILKEKDIDITSYDIREVEGKVEYGIAGTIEDKTDADVLMILNGFNVEKSIRTFKGDTIIIGGWMNKINNRNFSDYVADIGDPSNVVDGTKSIESSYTLELRPSYNKIIDMGWEYDSAYFNTTEREWEKLYCFYIFNRSPINDEVPI